MERMKMKVNPLPVRTWHWTRMNDSELKIEETSVPVTFSLRGKRKGLRWIPDVGTDSHLKAKNPDPVPWDKMETGMGEEFAGWIRKHQTALLEIPDGYHQEDAVLIDVNAFNGSAAGQLLIHAGADSDTTIIVTIRGDAEKVCDADTMALQLLVQAEQDAHLQLFVVQLLPRKGQSCLNLGGVCEENAAVKLVQLSLGARNTYLGIAMALKGKRSRFEGDLGYRVRPSQSVDVNYVARQEGKESSSRLNAWGVLEEGAKKRFRGTIDFKEGCSGSVGNEQEDVLLLGEHQVNQTLPVILCHEEDVEGNHGATISRLNEQMLFYLGSRGVEMKTAENMISRARLEALISKIPDPTVCQEAEQRIGPEEGERNA